MPSLMNGLSMLGSGVATFAGQAGLEQQKSDLADQQARLADQLATTRETTLQQSKGVIDAAAAEKAQAATVANTAVEQAGANTRNTATITGTAANTQATVAGEMARTQATINAPPDTVKLLRALGVVLPGATPPAGGAAPAATGTSGAASGTVPPAAATGASGSAAGTVPAPAAPGASGTGSSAVAAPVADPMDNPIIQKALGYPAAGSEDALRRSVAADVKSDPAFKYQTAGQQATETELRVQVAKGAMTSPETQAANAAMIASYQIKPPDGFALSRPGAAETMAMVSKFNPDYQESRFPEINKAMSAFGSGKQGDIVRSLDVGVQHLDVFDHAAAAIGNGDVQALNGMKNWFQQQFGVAAPTTLAGLKQIVGTEIEKAVSGGIGSASDRDRLMKSLDSANSPAQLQGMTDGFRALMAGQLNGLKRQYENDTSFKSGPFAFENKLDPVTIKALAAHSGGGATPTPADAVAPVAAVPSWVKPGDLYSAARGQARAADGTTYVAPVDTSVGNQ